MSYRKISQADARRYKKERDEARGTLSQFVRRGAVSSWPGTHIGSQTGHEHTLIRLRTARLLGHAVFVVPDDEINLKFYALKP